MSAAYVSADSPLRAYAERPRSGAMALHADARRWRHGAGGYRAARQAAWSAATRSAGAVGHAVGRSSAGEPARGRLARGRADAGAGPPLRRDRGVPAGPAVG